MLSISMKQGVMGLAFGALLLSGAAQAQDKVSDEPLINKKSGDMVEGQDPASETRVQREGAPPLAKQCHELAIEESDEGDEIADNSIIETNAFDYEENSDSDEPFTLRVDLLASGNAMYNLTCEVDNEGNVTFKDAEKSSTAKSHPGGA